MQIELTELNFNDGQIPELVVNVHSIRHLIPWTVGTVVEFWDGKRIHVAQSKHYIEQMILHAQEFQYATRADVRDPDDELFETSTTLAPGPTYVRNTIRSRWEDLTANEVDLEGLVEQDDRMCDQIRAEARDE